MAFLAARDLRSVTGRNVALVRKLSGEDPWTVSTNRVREALMESERVEPAAMDGWRCSYLSKLLEQRQEAHYRGMEGEKDTLTEMIESLCIN